MNPSRKLPPVWVMGLSVAPLGLYIGFYTIVFPAMLALRGVPGGQIASLIGSLNLAAVFGVLTAPILDFRLSRKTYAFLFSFLCAAAIATSVIFRMSPALLQCVLVIGTLSAAMVFGAVAPWTASLIPAEDSGRLGAWISVANFGSVGVIAVLAGQLTHLRPWAIAVCLAVLELLPTLLYIRIPAVKPDSVPAIENFKRFFLSIGRFAKQREAHSTMVLFLAPCASFAVASILAGFGKDFAADEHTVDVFGGVGASIAGLVGSLMLPMFARRFPLRPIYIATGCVGAFLTLGLLLLPHTPATFALAISGEQFFQALATATVYGLTIETVGKNNPSASTLYLFLASMAGVPLAYMTYLDGFAYAKRGLTGTLLSDAAISILACGALTAAFRLLPSFFSAPAPEEVENAF